MTELLCPDFLKLNMGQWMTLRTVYLPDNTFMCVHKANINLLNNNDQIYFSKNSNIYIKRDIINTKITNLLYALEKHPQESENTYQKLSNVFSFANKLNHMSTIYQINHLTITEKCWLVNPNLRLHISTIYKNNKCLGVSFCSAIKIV
uniref:Uncharacterized protein n=1 Tax=Helminthocladia australis TaxID=260093 RepID=A0A1G4NTJ5_9FLOR|nr:Hypothetical protein ycf58 [Helminthocladia australis]SCW21945.1 Hypothetical protein ycf58 [Helminthocladia australis]